MQIGNVEIENNIFLAPMAGVTDSSYRIIAKEMGAGLVTTEMISAKGLYYRDENTQKLMTIDSRERPIALQIFGSDPKIMGEVIEKHINPRGDIDIVDINMGCPAPKIVKNGDGSALMKNPRLVRQILKEVVRASNKPITLKIRMGWDKDSVNGIEIGKIAEEEGIAALTIHGRTRDMFYSGEADWQYIKKAKESLSIPIIGNGDIFHPIDAIRMMEYTNCDGVAIGRGAMGNPWIFKGTIPNSNEKIDMAIRHLDLLCKLKGEDIGVKEMRKHISWYLKGMKNSNVIKNQINTINEKTKMVNTLLEYKLELNQ